MTQRKRLSKHFVDSGVTKEVSMIFAFYGNHKPNGIGLSYQLKEESHCTLFADMFEAYKKQYEGADAAGKINRLSRAFKHPLAQI